MEEGQEVGGAFSEGESTDGEMLMAGWEDEAPPADGEVSEHYGEQWRVIVLQLSMILSRPIIQFISFSSSFF